MQNKGHFITRTLPVLNGIMPNYRLLLHPFFEKHGVDLVLQGHDHCYGRTGKILQNRIAPDDARAPIYVVSVSGSKMYRQGVFTMPGSNLCLNEHELKKFESLLLDKRSRIREHMAFLKRELVEYSSSFTNTSSFSQHMADAASATIEKEYIHRVLQQGEKDLQKIDSALMRIKEKTYGLCRITGKPINRERLEAIPETDISVEASKLMAP